MLLIGCPSSITHPLNPPLPSIFSWIAAFGPYVEISATLGNITVKLSENMWSNFWPDDNSGFNTVRAF